MSKLTSTNTFTALVTPFTENEAIDYESLDRLIKEQVKAGNGLVLLGSTGEGISLSLEEKYSLLRHVCQQDLPVPILAGVGGFQIDEVLDLLKVCETLPIDGYLMVSPIYLRPGPHGQTEWFRRLLDAVSKPCMLYNVPARAGTSLAIEVLQELGEHQNLWALKEASGSLDQFRAYRDIAPNLALYCGNDDLMPQLAMEGAAGLVTVMGNTWPEETSGYVEDSLKGDYIPSTELLSAIRCVSKANPVSVKLLLHSQGQIASPKLRAPLSEKDGSSPKEILAAKNIFVMC
jgi:4-hydroxy-tetrahydrodipicolinate synthase